MDIIELGIKIWAVGQIVGFVLSILGLASITVFFLVNWKNLKK